MSSGYCQAAKLMNHTAGIVTYRAVRLRSVGRNECGAGGHDPPAPPCRGGRDPAVDGPCGRDSSASVRALRQMMVVHLVALHLVALHLVAFHLMHVHHTGLLPGCRGLCCDHPSGKAGDSYTH